MLDKSYKCVLDESGNVFCLERIEKSLDIDADKPVNVVRVNNSADGVLFYKQSSLFEMNGRGCIPLPSFESSTRPDDISVSSGNCSMRTFGTPLSPFCSGNHSNQPNNKTNNVKTTLLYKLRLNVSENIKKLKPKNRENDTFNLDEKWYSDGSSFNSCRNKNNLKTFFQKLKI